MEMHRLVILGSMDEFVDLVKASKARGYYTIVCDGYADGPAKAFADKAYDIDIRDVDGVADMCKKENADGIVTSFSDIMFEHLVKIADRAGLPCYLSPDKLPYLREKPEMKRMFDTLSIPTPKSVKLEKDFLDEELCGLRFPLMIKPSNGYGSRGLHIVSSAAEIRGFYADAEKYSTAGHIIAEEYNPGHEFNLMTFIIDGIVHIIGLADREKIDPAPGKFPHLVRLTYPSRLLPYVEADACAIVQKVADYVGLTTGPMSMQFFWQKDRGIEVCEITGRLFGYEHELVTLASGLSIEEVLLDYVYDKENLKKTMAAHSAAFPRIAAGLYFHGKEGETVADLTKVRELAALPFVTLSILYYKEGETVSHEVGAKPYFTRFYIEDTSYEMVDADSKIVFGGMSSRTAEGEEIILRNTIPHYEFDLF